MPYEGLPALRGQGGNQTLQSAEKLLARQAPFRGAQLRAGAQLRLPGHSFVRLLASLPVDRNVRRRPEQKGAQIAHRPGLIQAQHPNISLLRDIDRFLSRADSRPQEANQRLVVLTE